MATWVTHSMIADGVLERHPYLHKNAFCVGNIAPDCNVENEDWTAFTPSREVTHWMQGERKTASDCEDFCNEYILTINKFITISREEYIDFVKGTIQLVAVQLEGKDLVDDKYEKILR